MKTFFALTLLSLLTYTGAHAQTENPAKIYVYNASGGVGKVLKLQTTTSAKTITIRSAHWAIIQTKTDSLGLLNKDQPYFIHFERGKKYYFIAQADYMPVFVFKEASEREFFLSVHANNLGAPDQYNLDIQN